MRKYAFMFVALILTVAGFAQEREGYEYLGHRTFRPFVETYTTKANGYQGWGFFGNGGVEYFLKHTTLSARAGVDTMDKTFIHSGTTVRVEGNGYYNLTKHFFVGGGAAWGRLETSQYSKQAVYPYFGAGAGCSDITMTANYYLSGTDKANHVHGLRFESMLPVVHRRLYLIQTFGIFSAQPEACPTCKREIVNDIRLGARYRF